MKNLTQQILAIWRQLGLNQRITIAVAIVAVFAGMFGLVAWSHRPQMQLLYGRLADKDIADVVAGLQEQNVKYEIGAGGGSVYVPADQVHKMRMLLAAKGVPAGDGVGFEIFDRTNFGISDFVQRTNYLRALQGELGRTIAQLHGVRSARVMIVMPENRLLFSETKSKPTASVFIDEGAGALDHEGVNSIRFLVANAVEGLHTDDVAVIDSHGNVLTEGMKEDDTLGTASSQMKLKKTTEDYLSSKVETMLAKVVGPGNAVVRVSADLDSDSTTKTQETFDPDGQVLRLETNTEDSTITSETDGETNANGAGVSSNTPSNNANANANKGVGKSSQQTRKNKSNNYEINKTTLNSVRAPGSVTRISAAVFVAAKAQSRKPEELEALRKMVVNALGVKVESTKDVDKIVTLEEAPFESAPAPKTGVTDVVYNNSDLIRNGVACVIAAGVLLLFLRLLKRTPPDMIPMELLQPKKLKGIGGNGGEISADMLNDLIRQKPANVGAALRGWMNETKTASKN